MAENVTRTVIFKLNLLKQADFEIIKKHITDLNVAFDKVNFISNTTKNVYMVKFIDIDVAIYDRIVNRFNLDNGLKQLIKIGRVNKYYYVISNYFGVDNGSGDENNSLNHVNQFLRSSLRTLNLQLNYEIILVYRNLVLFSTEALIDVTTLSPELIVHKYGKALVCFRCFKYHKQTSCTLPIHCIKCNKNGHMTNQCKIKRPLFCSYCKSMKLESNHFLGSKKCCFLLLNSTKSKYFEF